MKEKIKEQSKKTIKKTNESDLKKALIKKALGYDYKEVVEEYTSDQEGEVKLVKKKITKKNVPPDITALKILIENQTPISSMTDEELEEEKNRLIKALNEK